MRRFSLPPRYRTVAAIVLVIALAIFASMLFGGSDKKTQARSNSGGLHFRVVGQCMVGSGTLFGVGTGFTPGGNYVTEARLPNGNPYYRIGNPETADPRGATPDWEWHCADTEPGTGQTYPAGIYRVRLTDLETGKDTGWVPFTVGASK
jgi:hypothetical protein